MVFDSTVMLIIAIVVFVLMVTILAIVIPVSIKASRRKRLNKKFSDSESWIFALGDKENIIEVSATRSRLSVVLNDNEKIDKDLLKKLGVTSILTMSNKITLLIEDKAEQVAASIKKDL